VRCGGWAHLARQYDDNDDNDEADGDHDWNKDDQ